MGLGMGRSEVSGWMEPRGPVTLTLLLISSWEQLGGGQLPHHGVPPPLGKPGEICIPPSVSFLLPPPINAGDLRLLSLGRSICSH